MKVSDYITDFFYSKGINIVFGYQGGMITHLVDSIARHPEMTFVQVYHEQTGAIAAEGYSRLTGKIGVCISTSGPGATNMLTGIADAFFDSIPVIYITGQVNTYEYKYEKRIRQLGFQEMDVVSVVTPITKYAVMIQDATTVCYEFEKAYYIANGGRKGPVLLDIPMDILRAEILIEPGKKYTPPKERIVVSNQDLTSKVIEMIQGSHCPMFLLGGGVLASKGENVIENILRQTGIPFVTSLMGKGAVDEQMDNYMGMIGSYGNRMANIAVHNADLLIALGSRLDTRQTGAKYTSFLKSGTIIHVDIDNFELLSHRIKIGRLQILSDVKVFAEQLFKGVANYKVGEKWLNYCRNIKRKYNQIVEIDRFVTNKAPYKIIQKLNEYTHATDIVTSDIGQNQMWSAQTLQMKKDMRFLTSGGLAPMGYSIPVAIGAAFATQGQNKIWTITGDGGFHMSIQSLMLISQYQLPISVIVINNESLGMITQFQEQYFNSFFAGTDAQGGYLVPNLQYIAKSYGIDYFKIEENDLENQQLMDKIFLVKSCIVEYITNGKTKVYPKLEFDMPINNPLPYLPEEELCQTYYYDSSNCQ